MSSQSTWIVSPLRQRKCMVSCFVCRTLFGARTSPREISFLRQAWLCSVNLLLWLIALRQFLCMLRGVLLRPLLQARWLLTCAPVGIGWFCVVVLPSLQVNAGTMEAPLGSKLRQCQGWEYRRWLRRGASNTCPLVHLFLALLGQAKIVLLPARGRGKSPVVRWSCHGGSRCQVPQLVPQGGLW